MPDPPAAPPALTRAPRTGLSIRVADLDAHTFAALDAVTAALTTQIDQAQSIDTVRLFGTQTHLLNAIRSTHRSIRHLVVRDDADQDLAVDALTLTRVQLERTFLALLIVDRPDRWFKRYRKNAWKVFAEKFFRDQHCLGHLPGFDDYFGPSGSGIGALRAFAREMDVWEDEFQTLRVQIRGDEMDPRWEMRYIADMPTPGRAVGLLEDPDRRKLAEILYPFYDTLSHFSHGGLVGVMQAEILRRGPEEQNPDLDRHRFYQSNILEMTLPLSYVAALTSATLFALPLLAENPGLRTQLHDAWKPYHADGSPPGVLVWDLWARRVLDGDTPESDSGDDASSA